MGSVGDPISPHASFISSTCPVPSHPPSPLESVLTLLRASPLVSVRHLADGRAASSEITSLTTRSPLTPLLNSSLSLHVTHPKLNSISLSLSYWAPASAGRRRAHEGRSRPLSLCRPQSAVPGSEQGRLDMPARGCPEGLPAALVLSWHRRTWLGACRQ